MFLAISWRCGTKICYVKKKCSSGASKSTASSAPWVVYPAGHVCWFSFTPLSQKSQHPFFFGLRRAESWRRCEFRAWFYGVVLKNDRMLVLENDRFLVLENDRHPLSSSNPYVYIYISTINPLRQLTFLNQLLANINQPQTLIFVGDIFIFACQNTAISNLANKLGQLGRHNLQVPWFPALSFPRRSAWPWWAQRRKPCACWTWI